MRIYIPSGHYFTLVQIHKSLSSVRFFHYISLLPQVDPSDPENCETMTEQWFLFCVVWSLCAGVDEDGRKKMDSFIREMEGQFPPKDTVYEYYVDVKTRMWVSWEDKLKGTWRYPCKSVLKCTIICRVTRSLTLYSFLQYAVLQNFGTDCGHVAL